MKDPHAGLCVYVVCMHSVFFLQPGPEAAESLIAGGLAQQLLATNPGPAGPAPEATDGDRGCLGMGAAGSQAAVGLGLKGKGKGKGGGKGAPGGANPGGGEAPRKKATLVSTRVHMIQQIVSVRVILFNGWLIQGRMLCPMSTRILSFRGSGCCPSSFRILEKPNSGLCGWQQ